MTRPTHSTHYLGDSAISATHQHREVGMANPANGYAAEPALEILYRRPAYPLHGWLVRRPACAGVAGCHVRVRLCASLGGMRNEARSNIGCDRRVQAYVATSRNSRQRDWRVRTRILALPDCPRLVAMYGRETLLHEQVMEAATAFATTTPTTPAGVIAAVQFVCERYEAGFLERPNPGRKPEELEADRLR